MTTQPLDDDGFPLDYDERIERVCSEAASGFRACPSDLLAQLRVCCRYFQHGEREGISHGELIDFLGVSTPSVLDRADYTELEAQSVMDALTLLRYDEHGTPHPPDSLPPGQSQ